MFKELLYHIYNFFQIIIIVHQKFSHSALAEGEEQQLSALQLTALRRGRERGRVKRAKKSVSCPAEGVLFLM